ncbi:MAG TPA: prepilin peptidase [Rickettsiales bacterium]|nr:prepilin peptidase [Rickettsiales bacterium]
MTFAGYSPYLLLSLVFLLGICIGSFVTMASHRLPLSQEIVFKPSYCPHCHTKLGLLDLFPLLSWLWNKGKCRHCGAPVSIRYPLIELALGLAFCGIAFFHGLDINALLLMLLATELAILIVTDLEHYIIPDGVQIALLLTGLAYRFYNGGSNETLVSDLVVGIVSGLAIGLALHYGYLYLRKKDALGFGDVKFLAVAGCWLPLTAFVPFLFFSGLIGIFTGLLWRLAGRGAIFPFGPALAVSLFINVLFPDMMELLQRVIHHAS